MSKDDGVEKLVPVMIPSEYAMAPQSMGWRVGLNWNFGMNVEGVGVGEDIQGSATAQYSHYARWQNATS
jgi:hypothetical protein